MNKKTALVLSITIFLLFVIIVEGNGYIIHKIGYDEGVHWSPPTLLRDQILKFLLYQLIIFTLAIFGHKNFWVWLWTESFCLLGNTQDLIFYVWNGFIFPSGNWTWLSTHSIFGTWTTEMHFALSAVTLTFPILLWRFIPKQIYHGQDTKRCHYEANCLYCFSITLLKVMKRKMVRRVNSF